MTDPGDGVHHLDALTRLWRHGSASIAGDRRARHAELEERLDVIVARTRS